MKPEIILTVSRIVCANNISVYVHVITKPMTNITVRVPDELRAKMRALSDINWSEVVRKAIEGRIALEITRRKQNQEAIMKAGQRADAIYERLNTEHGSIKFDSSETIRYWRNHRYSGTS